MKPSRHWMKQQHPLPPDQQQIPPVAPQQAPVPQAMHMPLTQTFLYNSESEPDGDDEMD